MYELYFVLQLIVYINYFEFQKPAVAEIFIENFMNIIEFKILSPEPFIQIWIEDFTFKKFLSESQEEGSWLYNNYMFILAGLFSILVLMVIGILLLGNIQKQKITELIRKQKD